jgi:hypothetical protein
MRRTGRSDRCCKPIIDISTETHEWRAAVTHCYNWMFLRFTSSRTHTSMSSKDPGLGLGLLFIPAGLVLIVGIVAALFLFVLPA